VNTYWTYKIHLWRETQPSFVFATKQGRGARVRRDDVLKILADPEAFNGRYIPCGSREAAGITLAKWLEVYSGLIPMGGETTVRLVRIEQGKVAFSDEEES
jgi:hypothetical protein